MSNIDKQALREAAERAMHDDWGYDTDIFHEQVTPSVVLALLDELEHYKSREERVTKLVLDNSTSWDVLYEKLEAAERRIAELEARAVNLPKRSVDEVMHLSGFSRDYAEGWCAGNDNAIHEIRAAGIKVKGE
ncbi:ead/Ea22-like family protein [Salmonella enterica subsp. enterica serovar Oranienburg]|nr:ead/Ea22-like family protein [Salmonella enterica subsp. enterica serovar Agona]EHY9978561.1 ead/Ea22-like family protein [Salmonella enterica]EJB5041430.1 ead/Ea22-like family protein [Salmonella enterica]HBK8978004.1 ead/Ea22-like family protein [Salmonella enterica subsp. enterica serovar Bareilly]